MHGVLSTAFSLTKAGSPVVPALPVFPVVLAETALSLVEYKKCGKYKSDLFKRMLRGKYIYILLILFKQTFTVKLA